jgi:hypothetical protein
MYDIFVISNNENNATFIKLKERFPLAKLATSWDHAKQKAFTKFFWIVWPDLVVNDNFNFDYQVSSWDQEYIHVFKNGEFFDGVCLFPKSKLVSKKEFDYRFFINKKEIDIQASTPIPYEKFYINTFEEYQSAIIESKTDMFWVIWNNIIVNSDFNFDYQVSSWDQEYIHVFKNGEFFDGICLFSRLKPVSKKEFDYRFFINKKEIDIQASITKHFDIIFISYNESNADNNFARLKARFPLAKRVDGVKGIHQAHIAAAKKCFTKMFWVVDGDAVIADDFKFDYVVPEWDLDIVHVWRSINPINNLTYGYGGVKLLPRKMTIDMDTTSTDMTMSISTKFKAIPEISNITAFNTDAFSTWRSAFRECCKLSVINNPESLERLSVWCQLQEDVPYGYYAYAGALAGRSYGEKNASNKEALAKINDFTWLQDQMPKEISLQ